MGLGYLVSVSALVLWCSTSYSDDNQLCALVIQHAFTADGFGLRTPEGTARFARYKNEPHKEAPVTHRLVGKDKDIDAPITDRRSCGLCLEAGLRAPYSNYQDRLVRMRAGDSVVLTDARGKEVTYRLGKFLGAGNATHVYELADRPGEVIRLPFLPSPFYKGVAWRRNALMNNEIYVNTAKKIPDTVDRVDLLEVGEDFGYVVTTRVTGTQNGKQFLETETGASPDATRVEKERLLRLAVSRLHPGQFDEGKYKERARQFLWDERRWVLVDWE